MSLSPIFWDWTEAKKALKWLDALPNINYAMTLAGIELGT